MLRFIKQDFIVLLCFGGSLINFEYDRTDVSEVTDFNKTNNTHDCIVCHYYYLFK